MRRIVLQCESTTSNKIFSATMQKNNNRRILNKAVQSFPAAFISISTPANKCQNMMQGSKKFIMIRHFEGTTEKALKWKQQF